MESGLGVGSECDSFGYLLTCLWVVSVRTARKTSPMQADLSQFWHQRGTAGHHVSTRGTKEKQTGSLLILGRPKVNTQQCAGCSENGILHPGAWRRVWRASWRQ